MKKNVHFQQQGQGMTEYLIIVAIIAVSALAVTRTVGQNLRVNFGKMANALQGEAPTRNNDRYRDLKVEEVRDRDMKDFSEEASKRGN